MAEDRGNSRALIVGASPDDDDDDDVDFWRRSCQSVVETL